MKRYLLGGAAMLVVPGMAMANCPPVTMADMQGVDAGAFPGIFELADYEAAAGCSMEFSENPEIEALNAQIGGNPDLPPLAERLPAEPLVVVPYASIGQYGGTFNALSNATEAGTSDFMSVRHVNLVRYADDLETIVPHVAKGWEWNEDYTQLTLFLREGHRWSDGEPFTSADVKFWYDNLMMDENIYSSARDYALVNGEPMTVDTPDDTTVVFNLPAPKPGLLAHFATSYAPGFWPKHFLGQFHPEVNPDADAYAQSLGFENGYDAILAYYGNSDWMDTPTPMLSHPQLVSGLPAPTFPTLESHIVIEDTTEGRKFVANPYFFMVDTTGQQLPYISRQNEMYISDSEVRILTLLNGGAHYKAQSLSLANVPVLLDGAEAGNYSVQIRPGIAMHAISFNVTSDDPVKREVFGDVRFREAMSIALNREEINSVAYFDLGEIRQYTGFSPLPGFIDPAWEQYATEFDPDRAMALLDEVGLVDANGDGWRQLPDGAPLTLNLQFSTQDFAAPVTELIGQHWRDVGINTTFREVTSDEYRSAQSSNQLDVGLWNKGQPLAVVLGTGEEWIAPFGSYFGHRTGMRWAEWLESDGANGIEPPDYVKQLADDVRAFQSAEAGSEEFEMLGNRLVENMVSNLLFIGTALTPDPIYHSNALQNMTEFRTASYEYYRTYPYMGPQWWLDE